MHEWQLMEHWTTKIPALQAINERHTLEKSRRGRGGGWGLKGRSFGSKVSPAFSSFPSALAHVSSSRPETNGTSQVLEAGELEESLEESANENRLWEYEPQMSVPSLKHSLLHWLFSLTPYKQGQTVFYFLAPIKMIPCFQRSMETINRSECLPKYQGL